MSTNEMRKDYLIDRWVVIATGRKRRPTDFIREREVRRGAVCPFCPGNEHMTPPAILVYIESDGEIVKERDRDGFRHKGWLVRCIPNLYPAFTPPRVEGSERDIEKKRWRDYTSRDALGHHEVVVESPNHDEHPGVARISQLIHVINAYKDRFSQLIAKPYVGYVSIFRNHGVDAGASLSHAHTQIIATPTIPRLVGEELEAAREHYSKYSECAFCSILEREREGPRFIWENDSFIAFTPWASIHPFEFWIFPRRHQGVITDMTETETEDLALAMRVCLGALNRLLNDPSYNFGFHMVPDAAYHWHIEVYPRLAIWAGFEKSTGVYINVMSPEAAAVNLREAAEREEEALTGSQRHL